MEIIQLMLDDERMGTFMDKINVAYSERSNDIIKYEPFTMANINSERETIWVLIDCGEMVAGGTLFLCDEDTVKLKKIWVDISRRRGGYGSILLDEMERIAIGQRRKMLTLSVVSAYLPALALYRKKGFKQCGVLPKEFGTCRMIEMQKYIGRYKKSAEVKRCLQLLISRIKFYLRFKKDSRFNFIYSLIKRKKDNKS